MALWCESKVLKKNAPKLISLLMERYESSRITTGQYRLFILTKLRQSYISYQARDDSAVIIANPTVIPPRRELALPSHAMRTPSTFLEVNASAI